MYLIRKVELLETHFPHSLASKTKAVVMIIAMYSARTHQFLKKPFVNLQHKRENFLRSGEKLEIDTATTTTKQQHDLISL